VGSRIPRFRKRSNAAAIAENGRTSTAGECIFSRLETASNVVNEVVVSLAQRETPVSNQAR
jgi:hypothetical protein